jgi:hypothetical protein
VAMGLRPLFVASLSFDDLARGIVPVNSPELSSHFASLSTSSYIAAQGETVITMVTVEDHRNYSSLYLGKIRYRRTSTQRLAPHNPKPKLGEDIYSCTSGLGPSIVCLDSTG